MHSHGTFSVTWKKTGILGEILSRIIGRQLGDLECFYWTYDPQSHAAWGDLSTYSQIFGEKPGFGTAPDLIVRTEDLLCFIEVKFGSSHRTMPSNQKVGETYTSAVHGWYKKVFTADFDTVAVQKERYELMRQWLIGSRMADRADHQFLLLTIDLESQVSQAIQPFLSLIQEREARRFACTSWESIYEFISRCGLPTFDTQWVLAYMETKTLGVDKNGRLQRAFNFS